MGSLDDVRGTYVVLRALRPASSFPLPRPLRRVVPRPLLLRVVELDRPTRPRCVVRVVDRPVRTPWVERPDRTPWRVVERPALPRDCTARPVVVSLLRPTRVRGAVVPRAEVPLCTPLERAVVPRALRVAELRPTVAPRGWYVRREPRAMYDPE